MKQYDSMVFWPVEDKLNNWAYMFLSGSIEDKLYAYEVYPAYLATPTNMAECFVALYED